MAMAAATSIPASCEACVFGAVSSTVLSYTSHVIKTIEVDVTPHLYVFLNGTTITTSLESHTHTEAIAVATDETAKDAPAAQTFSDAKDITWQVGDATLTYPTSYVQYLAFAGAPASPTDGEEGTCARKTDATNVQLPTSTDAAPYIYPLSNATDERLPAPLLDYLHALPVVSSQFPGEALTACAPLPHSTHDSVEYSKFTPNPAHSTAAPPPYVPQASSFSTMTSSRQFQGPRQSGQSTRIVTAPSGAFNGTHHPFASGTVTVSLGQPEYSMPTESSGDRTATTAPAAYSSEQPTNIHTTAFVITAVTGRAIVASETVEDDKPTPIPAVDPHSDGAGGDESGDEVGESSGGGNVSSDDGNDSSDDDAGKDASDSDASGSGSEGHEGDSSGRGNVSPDGEDDSSNNAAEEDGSGSDSSGSGSEGHQSDSSSSGKDGGKEAAGDVDSSDNASGEHGNDSSFSGPEGDNSNGQNVENDAGQGHESDHYSSQGAHHNSEQTSQDGEKDAQDSTSESGSDNQKHSEGSEDGGSKSGGSEADLSNLLDGINSVATQTQDSQATQGSPDQASTGQQHATNTATPSAGATTAGAKETISAVPAGTSAIVLHQGSSTATIQDGSTATFAGQAVSVASDGSNLIVDGISTVTVLETAGPSSADVGDYINSGLDSGPSATSSTIGGGAQSTVTPYTGDATGQALSPVMALAGSGIALLAMLL